VLVRLHWNLLKLEEHSELFISGLKCILHEHRIPSRLQVAIDELQNDALGLAEMLTDDTWGKRKTSSHSWILVDYLFVS